MAEITLTNEEAESVVLPNVCIQCGMPSEYEKRVVFEWHPFWVDLSASLICMGAVIYITLLVLYHKKRVVYAPVCARHRGYGEGMMTIMLTSCVVAIAGVFGVFFMLWNSPGLIVILLLTWFMSVFCFFVLFMIHLVWHQFFCDVARITAKDITLKNVHPNFVAALQEDRKREAEAFAHQANVSDDDDDDDDDDNE